MGVDPADIDEAITAFGMTDASPQSHLEWVFSGGQRVVGETRFSNGTLPVYYTAMDDLTAIAEVSHWLPKVPGAPVYYRLINVEFEGLHKDLRGIAPAPACLIGECANGAYAECQAIAAAAVDEGLDALLTHSARRVGGACLPVLAKRSIQALVAGPTLRLDLSDSTGQWLSRVL